MTNRIPRPVLNFGIGIGLLITSVIVITWLLKTRHLSAPVRVVLALIPPIIWAFTIIFLLRLVRLLDELQRRIHLEALAIAFPSTGVEIITCEYLRKAGFIAYLMPDHVLMILMALWIIGYLIARRRYQ
ncbi:MAG: hypothetical protein MOB07_19905 [Acidobacteria bacterium]|nr:hypothetical protein [Acidobacteriota bacterium]